MAEAARAILLDTSVIVRYLTRDPPDLAARAATVIESGHRLLLSPVALVESAFVLTRVYQAPRDAVVEALSALVQRRNLEPIGLTKTRVLEALDLCTGSNRTSFADALLWAEAREANAAILTFDRRFPPYGAQTIVPGEDPG